MLLLVVLLLRLPPLPLVAAPRVHALAPAADELVDSLAPQGWDGVCRAAGAGGTVKVDVSWTEHPLVCQGGSVQGAVRGIDSSCFQRLRYRLRYHGHQTMNECLSRHSSSLIQCRCQGLLGFVAVGRTCSFSVEDPLRVWTSRAVLGVRPCSSSGKVFFEVGGSHSMNECLSRHSSSLIQCRCQGLLGFVAVGRTCSFSVEDPLRVWTSRAVLGVRPCSSSGKVFFEVKVVGRFFSGWFICS